MSNNYFQFKQFRINQENCAMKVNTEACILGASAKYFNPKSILDIGTGTGLLALMMAQRYEGQIDAIEIDEGASRQAKGNLEASPWKDRLRVFHDDIAKFTADCVEQYDLIVSNPPFFSNSLKSAKSSNNLAKHDDSLPKLVLIASIKKLLSDIGLAFILLPEKESDELKDIAKEDGLQVKDSLIIKNKAGSNIFRKIIALGNIKNVKTHELIIRNDSGDYSKDFIQLLQPYYLKL